MNKSETAEYACWQGMRQRCNNPRSTAFKNYGGNGVTVCERWSSFEAFLADMGPRPSRLHSIDRIDVFGNYEQPNCRWATAAEQSRNLRVHASPDVGVSFSKRDKSWSAFITANRKTIRVGSFPDKGAAIEARKTAEERYWRNGETPPDASDTQRNNKSGHRGVCYHPRDKRWLAYVYQGRKRIDLGRFTSIDDAVSARIAHGIGEQQNG